MGASWLFLICWTGSVIAMWDATGMARFRCATCGRKGECDYESHRHECPLCQSPDVVFALAIDELPEELVAALLQAEPLDDDDNSED